jgi:hypothetical protein
MFERFTGNARAAVVFASDFARAGGHVSIGPEHLLLALIHDGRTSAVAVIEGLGIAPAGLRRRIAAALGSGPGAPRGNIPLTGAAKQVLLLSLREALLLGHDHIGTEHLLLGLIREGQGLPARALTQVGAGLEAVRARVGGLGPRRPEAPPAIGLDGRRPGLGRVFLCYRREDLAPGAAEELSEIFRDAALVMSADADADADAIARCDVVLVFAGAQGPVHAAVGAARSLRKPVVLGRDQHDLPLLVATLMRLYAPTGAAAPNQVVRASARPGPPDQAT